MGARRGVEVILRISHIASTYCTCLVASACTVDAKTLTITIGYRTYIAHAALSVINRVQCKYSQTKAPLLMHTKFKLDGDVIYAASQYLK